MRKFCHLEAAMSDDFPAVQGGGSLLLAWQIKNKRVLVVGGGEVGDCHLRIQSLYNDFAGRCWANLEHP